MGGACSCLKDETVESDRQKVLQQDGGYESNESPQPQLHRRPSLIEEEKQYFPRDIAHMREYPGSVLDMDAYSKIFADETVLECATLLHILSEACLKNQLQVLEYYCVHELFEIEKWTRQDFSNMVQSLFKECIANGKYHALSILCSMFIFTPPLLTTDLLPQSHGAKKQLLMTPSATPMTIPAGGVTAVKPGALPGFMSRNSTRSVSVINVLNPQGGQSRSASSTATPASGIGSGKADGKRDPAFFAGNSDSSVVASSKNEHFPKKSWSRSLTVGSKRKKETTHSGSRSKVGDDSDSGAEDNGIDDTDTKEDTHTKEDTRIEVGGTDDEFDYARSPRSNSSASVSASDHESTTTIKRTVTPAQLSTGESALRTQISLSKPGVLHQSSGTMITKTLSHPAQSSPRNNNSSGSKRRNSSHRRGQSSVSIEFDPLTMGGAPGPELHIETRAVLNETFVIQQLQEELALRAVSRKGVEDATGQVRRSSTSKASSHYHDFTELILSNRDSRSYHIRVNPLLRDHVNHKLLEYSFHIIEIREAIRQSHMFRSYLEVEHVSASPVKDSGCRTQWLSLESACNNHMSMASYCMTQLLQMSVDYFDELSPLRLKHERFEKGIRVPHSADNPRVIDDEDSIVYSETLSSTMHY